MDFSLFSERYNAFLDRCAEAGKNPSWNEDEYCEMSLFYENSLTNLILSLVVSDEKIQEKEVEFLNMFGVGSYTEERLQEIYSMLRESIDNYYEKDIIRDIELLKKVDTGLADEYTELVKAACDLVISSDGVITDSEKQRASQLLDKL